MTGVVICKRDSEKIGNKIYRTWIIKGQIYCRYCTKKINEGDPVYYCPTMKEFLCHSCEFQGGYHEFCHRKCNFISGEQAIQHTHIKIHTVIYEKEGVDKK